MQKIIPQPLTLAQLPTPIEYLHRLSDIIGGPEIWVKRDDLTGSVLSGNKLRKLEYCFADAFQQGAKVVITVGGVQSNHCRATALLCARLGLKCHLLLRGTYEGEPDGNLLLDMLADAEITFLTNEAYSTSQPEIVDALMEDYRKQGILPYYIPVGASNAVGSLGYMDAWFEIAEQAELAGRKFDHIVTAVGSGGTMAGLMAGKALDPAGGGPEVWGVNVCNDAEYFTNEIRSILMSLQKTYGLDCYCADTEIQLIDGFVGPGYAQPYKEMMDTIRLAARTEGLILDPVYTGKAFHGLLQSVSEGKFRKGESVLFLHTGGVFGLFPQRSAFEF